MLVAGAKLLAQLPVDSRRGPHAVKLAAAADAAVLDVAAAAETRFPVVRHDVLGHNWALNQGAALRVRHQSRGRR